VFSAFYRAGRKWKCEIDEMRTGNAANIHHSSIHKIHGEQHLNGIWLNEKVTHGNGKGKYDNNEHCDKIKRCTTFIA